MFVTYFVMLYVMCCVCASFNVIVCLVCNASCEVVWCVLFVCLWCWFVISAFAWCLCIYRVLYGALSFECCVCLCVVLCMCVLFVIDCVMMSGLLISLYVVVRVCSKLCDLFVSYCAVASVFYVIC